MINHQKRSKLKKGAGYASAYCTGIIICSIGESLLYKTVLVINLMKKHLFRPILIACDTIITLV